MDHIAATGLRERHPLARLTAEEYLAARDVLRAAGLAGETMRFTYVGLREPAKAEVRQAHSGGTVDRQVRAILLDATSGDVLDVVVSLSRKAVVEQRRIDPAVEGQPAIMLEDLIAVDEIVKSDPDWCAAMARRGIVDLDLVRPCPLSAGSFGLDGEQGRRMLRVLSFLQHRPEDHPWAHPIDGIVAFVDLVSRQVVRLVDHADLPVPREEGNYDDPAYTGPARTTLRPIEITQPEGPSFTVVDDVVTWEGWQVRVGFDAREGLTLHEISIQGRPVVYRASVSEMVVPYADPSPVRFWQNYFDAGEYLLGQQVSSLALGCDCLGEIHYFDAVLPTEDGDVREVQNAICLHEEDFGVLWKHTDLFTEAAETRRQRRLVISSFVAIGNYDYGFYWYLYLDGSIELEVKSTGIVFTSAYVDGSPYANELAPGLGAPYHQHFFSARLDMTVDGDDNAVDEVELQRLPVGPDNPYGNAFTRRVTRLSRESDAVRDADTAVGRVWRVSNPASTNRMGQPVAYTLHPQPGPLLAADPSSSIAGRAGFAGHHLWVTRYERGELYAAGDLPNQHPGGAGLPAYVAQDRDIDGTDIVVWHTFGLTHLPRLEDWPVMPVARCGFTLAPTGFFDRNPTLDLPRSTASHCHPGHPAQVAEAAE